MLLRHWVPRLCGGRLLEQLRFNCVVLSAATTALGSTTAASAEDVIADACRTSATFPRAEFALHDRVDVIVLTHNGYALPFRVAAVGSRPLALRTLARFGHARRRPTLRSLGRGAGLMLLYCYYCLTVFVNTLYSRRIHVGDRIYRIIRIQKAKSTVFPL